MANNPRRIVIDTNLWIHFLISKNYLNLDRDLSRGKAQLIFSQGLLDEFLEVIERPKFQKYFSSDDIIDILNIIDNHADFVQVSSQIEVCRDKKDNFLLSLCVDASADFLITGDKDLLDRVHFKLSRN